MLAAWSQSAPGKAKCPPATLGLLGKNPWVARGGQNLSSMTTSTVAAPPPLPEAQAQQSQEQVVRNEGLGNPGGVKMGIAHLACLENPGKADFDKKYRHKENLEGNLSNPDARDQGGDQSFKTGKVCFPVEASPIINVGENVEKKCEHALKAKAVPEGKRPPLDVIPSARVPAAENISKRNSPHPLAGGSAGLDPAGLPECNGRPIGPNQGGQDAQENDATNKPEIGKVFLPVEASLTNEGSQIGKIFLPVEVPPALQADEQDKTVALYSGNFVPSGSGEEVSENKTTQEKYRGNPLHENRCEIRGQPRQFRGEHCGTNTRLVHRKTKEAKKSSESERETLAAARPLQVSQSAEKNKSVKP